MQMFQDKGSAFQGYALRREENKFELLERRFLDEKLPFLHKKKAGHSFEPFLSIFCLLTVYYFFNNERTTFDLCRSSNSLTVLVRKCVPSTVVSEVLRRTVKTTMLTSV